MKHRLMVMLAILMAALTAFAWTELAGAVGPSTKRCADGKLVWAEHDPGDWDESDPYAIQHHWMLDNWPCGDWPTMPAQMISDNAWWFEQYGRWWLRLDDWELDLWISPDRGHFMNTCREDYAESSGCANSGIASDFEWDEEARIQRRTYRIGSDVWLLSRDGQVSLVALIHELSHALEDGLYYRHKYLEGYLNVVRDAAHGWGFYRAMRDNTFDLLGLDMRPWCLEHGQFC